ncbi:transposase [Candidatus Omnitrophota bacterium]
MARPLRIEFPGAWYHVMNRGRRKEKIFFDDGDREAFLQALSDAHELFHIEIHAFVLMMNHYHLLVHTPKSNLSRCMRHINGVYTQKINIKHKMDGAVFRGRYKSILVDEEEYLLELVRYIHRNPLKKGIVDRPQEYKWSSHRIYMDKALKPRWMTLEDVLSRFSTNEREAQKKFSSFIDIKVPKDLLKKLDSVKWPAVLGGKLFKEKVKEAIKGREINLREISSHRKEIIDIENDVESLERLIESIKDSLETKRKNIAVRKAFIYIMRRYYSMNLREIGQRLGYLTYSAVSKKYKEAENEIRERTGCYKEVVKVLKDLKSQIKI